MNIQMRKHTFKLEKIWTFVDRDKRDFEGMGEGIVWSWLWGKRRVFEGEGEFCCTLRGLGWLIWVWGWVLLHVKRLRVTDLGVWVRVFELWESVWETKSVWECLSEAFESGCVSGLECADFKSYKLDLYVAKFGPHGKFVHVRVWQTPKIEF